MPEAMTDHTRLLAVLLEDVDRRLGLVDLPERGPEDSADFAARMHEKDVTVAGQERLREKRRLILAALGRLKNGMYGKCLDCGAPIPAPRLRVYPEAETCVPCATIRERDPREIQTRVERERISGK